MANFAHVSNGVVINIIIAENKDIAEMVTGGICVEYTDANPAGIGWAYENNIFTAPVLDVIVSNPVVRVIAEPTE